MNPLLLLLFACNIKEKVPLTETGIVSAEPSQEPGIETDDSAIEDSGEIETGFECSDLFSPSLDWFAVEEVSEMQGDVSFAQTHVISEEETRLAPSLVTHRAMTILFDPESDIDAGQDIRISAWKDEQLLGVLAMDPPSFLPEVLESQLTEEILEPWSETAWSAFLPYHWVESGVELQIGKEENGVLYRRLSLLGNLSAPHVFTVSRSKIVLFGEQDFETDTVSASQLSQDFFATVPFAELRWVDSTPWVLDEIVVKGVDGPVLVSSEGERNAMTTDPDRWNILKHIFTRRLHLANIGKGLYNPGFTGGNSPYSFGTTLGLGWVQNDDGLYVDINNAPYSAGWTGWSSIWQGECSNVFNHEIGHSMTLEHFTGGAAASWGIDSEYPLNGENLVTHPWGFDTTRNMFRSWYRVDGTGVVYKEDGSIQGKRDSMNGGESSNMMTCFPQYTAYHSWKIQNWAETRGSFRDIDGNKSLFTWNVQTQEYEEYFPSEFQPDLLALNKPTATIIGALGEELENSTVYPPIYWSSGNQFELPDPQQPDLIGDFDGANYYLKITYQDGTEDYALINQTTVSSEALELFSVNIDLRRSPETVQLFRSETGYPNINYATSTELYSRTILEPDEDELEPVLLSGKGALANGTLVLTDRCEQDINCEQRRVESFWRVSSDDIYFTEDSEDIETCSDLDSRSSFLVTVNNEEGETQEVTVLAQRVIRSQEHSWATILNDRTPWTSQANQEQGLRLWLPYSENQDLGAGQWHGEHRIFKWQGDASSEIAMRLDFEVLEADVVDLASPFESESLSTPNSSLYFLLSDPTIGPTTRVWWGNSDPTPLTIPVIDQETGASETLHLNSWKKTCNLGWGTMWSLNSGQTADDDCPSQVYLALPDSGNEHLESGHLYQSPVSQPIIFEGLYWHGSFSGQLAGRFVFQFQYQVP